MTTSDQRALAADVVAVLVFVAVGRSSHDEGLSPLGFLTTLWPFLAGLLVGWLMLVRRDLPGTRVQAGLVTGGYAAVVGLALRGLVGQGLAWSFAIVAVLVLVLLMTAWRLGLVAARLVRT